MADVETSEVDYIEGGKYDPLIAVIVNSTYVIVSVQDMDLTLYPEAGKDVISTIVHSLKVIRKAQEAILKGIANDAK
jgi:hypothetical protein